MLIFCAVNSILYISLIKTWALAEGISFGILGYSLLILLSLYVWLRIQAIPCSTDKEVATRVKVVYQGRFLLILFFALLVAQLILFLLYYQFNPITSIPSDTFRNNSILAFVLIILTFLNGFYRILIFSTRLRIVRRIVVCCLIWIPVVNIFVIIYLCRIASNEYDHACNKAYNENMRKDSSVCETKYPLLMLHGVGFRDYSYINYWGRIPKNLVKNGASLYYGHQQAFGTIEGNGQMIKEKILDIVDLTGCGKVNIIAHSKGGLDARYAISTLGMGDYVASLTTISTPHRGSALADYGNKHVSDKLYRSVAKFFDKYFLKIGDLNPDFYTATHQLTKEYSLRFNENTPDVDSVFYQSYMSLMKNCFSHSLLSVTYLIMRMYDKQNDGLVALDSARWGEFREVFENKKRRGISHGDMIDITRGNYKGFDVIETYINIVSDLKNKGF
ncbi:triacylglycerol lipase [Dysgonomonas sp. PF1-14]|uniref:esterase/lipase family protein n=1 Tax=unclassified Dysgonomonas TaxID=2630389 RepID=UPI0024746923|nr:MULTISPECIES: triacylglycerol lipase [unclassified Dysgonomonas]MDH6307875.1 triacylglycerol lipase [Dysgonomonas sp. PF1-14]MDH6337793.1 triacylglycerol lipase [Dysgonomonas sp. PF1-16]MDH6396652.1 triacylglycerol lipase [Dysgonomonas sp. PF1-23]